MSTLRARESGGARPPEELFALKHLLHEQRLIKSAAEVRAMRRAAEITCAGHVRAMRACEPGMTETQLEAELIYAFMRGGAKSPAYSSIVGSGVSGTMAIYAGGHKLFDGKARRVSPYAVLHSMASSCSAIVANSAPS